MAVYLAWLGDPAQSAAVLPEPGPWSQLREAAPGLLLVETEDTVSRVFHELKWMLPDGCPLLVAPLEHRPKARGLAQGTVSWLRQRLPLPRVGTGAGRGDDERRPAATPSMSMRGEPHPGGEVSGRMHR